MQEFIDEGIACISRQKIDVLIITIGNFKNTLDLILPIPSQEYAMMIGNLDRIEHNSGLEQKTHANAVPGITGN